MKSMYAVAGQMVLSASNYVVFVLLAQLLSPSDFVGFATAVGLNMLAYAVAEGGVSYVAPRELADQSNLRNGSLAGAFVAISMVLYVISLCIGYFLWNSLSKDQLDVRWVMAYAVYFGPAILIPAWVTCWSMDQLGLIALVIMRAAMLAAIYMVPSPESLAMGGVVFCAFVFCLLAWLNRIQRCIGWTDSQSIVVAGRHLREVFAAKTLSYTVYSLLPLVVGVLRGNAAAANYVTGERIKSLYATVFQPLIQSLYLWQFQSAVTANRRRLVILAINLGNLVVCTCLLVAIHTGTLELLGARFSTVEKMPMYAIAAALSVATTSLLYFVVFPSADYTVFRRASFVQFVTFGGLFIGMAWAADLSPAWVLCIGEAMLLAAVVGQLLSRKIASPVK
jgi:hypothetical protein